MARTAGRHAGAAQPNLTPIGLHYTWYAADHTGATTIVGTDSNILTTQVTKTTRFRVAVQGACGPVQYTQWGQISVVPTIATQPADASVCSGTNASFSVATSNDPAIVVSWYSGTPSAPTLLGTGLTLTVPNVTAQKSVWAVASSGNASVTSRTATAYVESGPPVSSI